MDEQQVTLFLDWLTAAGAKQMEYAIYPGDEKPQMYRDGQRVTLENMQTWARNWMEDSGQVPTDNRILYLATAALKKVVEETVYPRLY